MESLAQDLRFALRSLSRRPRFTVTVVVTVAVGIVATATVFGAIHAVLFAPLPYFEDDRLLVLESSNEQLGVTSGPISWVDMTEWRELDEVFEGIAGTQGVSAILTGRGEPANLSAARVSPGMFSLLGIEPILGRGFHRTEETHGNHRVVVLSHGLWTTRFGSDPGILGQSLTLDGVPHQVVGVLPASARLPIDLAYQFARDVYLPLAPAADDMPRGRRAVGGVARLRPGVSRAQAGRALQLAHERQATDFPDDHRGWSVQLRSVAEVIVGPFRRVLTVLMGAALALLLLACVNVVNMMLVRGAGRGRELAIRTSLGAGRGRLVRQLLVEGGALSIAGTGVGLLGAQWTLTLFARLSPGDVPRLDQAAIDLPVVGVALATALAIGLLFSGIPALVATRGDAASRLGGFTRTASAGRNERRLLGTMVATQVALAVLLLIGAGLFGRSVVTLLSADPGFERQGILTARFVLIPPAYPDLAARNRFIDTAVDRFGALPGVESVGVTNFLPYSGNDTVDGFDLDSAPTDEQRVAGFRAVDAGYFDTLGIRVVSGRGFERAELRTGGRVALVNESMAARFWPGRSPLGQRIARDDDWMEIVGVVADVRHAGPDAAPTPEWYAPYTIDPYRLKAFVLKTSVPPERLAAPLRAALFEIDPTLPPMSVETMDEFLAQHISGPRFNLAMMGAFASAALLVAAIGVFAMIAYSITRRTKELAIRIVVGASRREIFSRLIAHGVGLAWIGIAAGSASAFAMARTVESLLLGVEARDPAVFAAVAVLMIGVAGFASFLAARRTVNLDPVTALRAE